MSDQAATRFHVVQVDCVHLEILRQRAEYAADSTLRSVKPSPTIHHHHRNHHITLITITTTPSSSPSPPHHPHHHNHHTYHHHRHHQSTTHSSSSLPHRHHHHHHHTTFITITTTSSSSPSRIRLKLSTYLTFLILSKKHTVITCYDVVKLFIIGLICAEVPLRNYSLTQQSSVLGAVHCTSRLALLWPRFAASNLLPPLELKVRHTVSRWRSHSSLRLRLRNFCCVFENINLFLCADDITIHV